MNQVLISAQAIQAWALGRIVYCCMLSPLLQLETFAMTCHLCYNLSPLLHSCAAFKRRAMRTQWLLGFSFHFSCSLSRSLFEQILSGHNIMLIRWLKQAGSHPAQDININALSLLARYITLVHSYEDKLWMQYLTTLGQHPAASSTSLSNHTPQTGSRSSRLCWLSTMQVVFSPFSLFFCFECLVCVDAFRNFWTLLYQWRVYCLQFRLDMGVCSGKALQPELKMSNKVHAMTWGMSTCCNIHVHSDRIPEILHPCLDTEWSQPKLNASLSARQTSCSQTRNSGAISEILFTTVTKERTKDETAKCFDELKICQLHS